MSGWNRMRGDARAFIVRRGKAGAIPDRWQRPVHHERGNLIEARPLNAAAPVGRVTCATALVFA